MSGRAVRDRVADEIGDACRSLEEHPVRLLLLILVFALGAGGAVVARGVSSTSSQQVAERLSAAALDEVRLRPVPLPEQTSPPQLPEEAVTTASELSAVRSAAVLYSVPAEAVIVRGAATGPLATPSDAAAVTGVAGDWAGVLDVRLSPASAAWLVGGGEHPHVAVVGEKVAAELGLPHPGPGSRVVLNGAAYDVVGVIGQSARDPALRDAVVIPAESARRLAPGQGETVLRVRTDRGAARPVAEALPVALDPAQPGRFAVDAVPDLQALRRGVATDLDASVLLISVLLLVTASITTGNTMAMSVMSRTPEIALRKAIGASRARIARLFLLQGALIGAAGGLIGTAGGVVGVVGIAVAHRWTPVLTSELVPLGLLVGALVGLLSAAYPAVTAANVAPGYAIRGE